MYILLLSSGLTSMLYTLAGCGIAFGIGFGLKQALIRKGRKRILELENGMLKDHAAILKLENKLSQLEEENILLKKYISNREEKRIDIRQMMT